MKLLTSTDFALRVLILLASTPETHISTDALAQELVVSRHHLHKIVQFLTEVGLVRTIRGARGSVLLARPASQIILGAVIRRHEKDQALVECFRPDGGACNSITRLTKISGNLLNFGDRVLEKKRRTNCARQHCA